MPVYNCKCNLFWYLSFRLLRYEVYAALCFFLYICVLISTRARVSLIPVGDSLIGWSLFINMIAK